MELLVVITIIGILLGILLPAVQAAREAARRAQCSSNLRQLGLAIQMYHDANGRFPPGANLHSAQGKESIGWRVLILPYLEESILYDQIQPMPDGGAFDRNPRTYFINVLICPSAERQDANPTLPKVSNYTGVAGPGRNGRRIVVDVPFFVGDVSTDGMFFLNSRTKMAKIEDGTSQTIAIGERTYHFNEDWMRGAWWYGKLPTETTADGEIYMAGAKNVTYRINADRYYIGDPNVPPGTDPDELVKFNDLYFGSKHPSIAQFCFADGSVRPLNDTMDITVLGDRATIAGGEIISDP